MKFTAPLFTSQYIFKSQNFTGRYTKTLMF